jgi:hypothetical protein
MPTQPIYYIICVKLCQPKGHQYTQYIKNLYPSDKTQLKNGEIVNLGKFQMYALHNPESLPKIAKEIEQNVLQDIKKKNIGFFSI